jgi:hypothetical protein
MSVVISNTQPLNAWTKEELVQVDIIDERYGKVIIPDFVDASGNTPLIEAIKKQDFELASVLVKMGVNIHRSGSDGQSPLEIATALENGEFAHFLRTYGA